MISEAINVLLVATGSAGASGDTAGSVVDTAGTQVDGISAGGE